jgi:hypothetical protein
MIDMIDMKVVLGGLISLCSTLAANWYTDKKNRNLQIKDLVIIIDDALECDVNFLKNISEEYQKTKIIYFDYIDKMLETEYNYLIKNNTFLFKDSKLRKDIHDYLFKKHIFLKDIKYLQQQMNMCQVKKNDDDNKNNDLQYLDNILRDTLLSIPKVIEDANLLRKSLKKYI